MNKRNFVRYGSELLPGSLSKVDVSWEGTATIRSYVADFGPQGMSLIIPATPVPLNTPKEQETVKVLMPTNQTWFTGQCVYAKCESDGSLSIGIHFADPKEQRYLKKLLFSSLNVPSGSPPYISYEWEELVAKMCESDDPQLAQIGWHHRTILKKNQDRQRTCN